MKKTLPEAAYCCSNASCCEEVTWPAQLLWWSEDQQGWYCDACWVEENQLFDKEKGITLEEELKNRGLYNYET